MTKKVRFLIHSLILSTMLVASGVFAADNDNSKESSGLVLFKIHDIVPEKDANGKVLYCNVGATFFNRTKADISNASLTLTWNDDVIGEAIDQEERADKELRRTNPNSPRPRYSTSGFTGKTINTSLKLPPLKVGQQVSLKTKVDTDRCFLLLNDMDVTVNNCGTAGLSSSNSRRSNQACKDLFSYVSPKMPEYYMEFREISHEEQLALEDAKVEGVYKEMNDNFDATVKVIKEITVELPKTEETDAIQE